MLVNRIIAAAVFALISPCVSHAASIIAVGQSADVVIIGDLIDFGSGPTAGQFKLNLRVSRVLKGQTGTVAIEADLVSGDTYSPPSSIPRSLVGQTGIWFLLQAGSGYQVIPTTGGRFLPNEIFLPLSDSLATPIPSGTFEGQLLQYTVAWYRSLSSPAARDDMKCLDTLQSQAIPLQDALEAAKSLIGSLVVADQVVGFAAAIALGSDDAVNALSTSIDVVGASPKFYLIGGALATLYMPHGVGSIRVLKQLIDRHSSAPGIDAAAGAALSKIVVKQTLPVMAELLSSSDPAAQLRAAKFFGLFALFADGDGYVSGGGPTGPFATGATRQYTPRKDSGISPAEYSQFWQQWWAQNRAALGL